MIQWLLAPLFNFDFLKALAAGLLISTVCAGLGFFAVQKRLAFLGDGLAHSTFGGAALGLFIGFGTSQAGIFGLASCLLVALLLVPLTRNGKIHGDSAVGLLFAVSMSLGAIFLHRVDHRDGEQGHSALEDLLFGNILEIPTADLTWISGLLILCGLTIAIYFKKLAYFSFDPELAELSGVSPNQMRWVLMILMGLVVGVSVRAVGATLVSSLLIIPILSAKNVAQDLGGILKNAILISLLGTLIGLWVSYYVTQPSGPCIVLTHAVLFLITYFRKSGRDQNPSSAEGL